MIKNLKDLRAKGELKEDDKLMFGDLEYTVYYSYLNYEEFFNDKIFEKLNIKDKYEFCSKAYGYKVNTGHFPDYKGADFKAAYRVAEALYIALEGEEYKEGDKVLVRDDESDKWEEGIYLCTVPGNCNKYILVNNLDKERYKSGEEFDCVPWKHIKPLNKEEPEEMTMADLEKELGKKIKIIK